MHWFCECVTKEILCSVVISVKSCLCALKKPKICVCVLFCLLSVRKVDVYLISACLVSFCYVFCSISLYRFAMLSVFTLFLCTVFKCLLYQDNDWFGVNYFFCMGLSIVSRIKSRSLVHFVSTELAIGFESNVYVNENSFTVTKAW